MIELSETESRDIRAGMLRRQYPRIEALLDDGEVLRAVSRRKPHYAAGVFCVGIGLLSAWQVSVYAFLTDLRWLTLSLFFFF